jgi:hypothetical protein
MGLHYVLGQVGACVLKVYDGNTHLHFNLPPGTVSDIRQNYSSITSLTEAKLLDTVEIWLRCEEIKLSSPISSSSGVDKRQLLNLLPRDEMNSIGAVHNNASALFPNPINGKGKGSRALSLEAASASIRKVWTYLFYIRFLGSQISLRQTCSNVMKISALQNHSSSLSIKWNQ